MSGSTYAAVVLPEFVSVPLQTGRVALIDLDDLDLVGDFSDHWQERHQRGSHSSYAIATGRGDRIPTPMHVLLLNPPRGFWCDHINGDGLDNRRLNLRVVTPSQNALNRHVSRSSLSGFKGVRPQFDSRNKKQYGWTAWISDGGKRRYVGHAATAELAARMYDEAARKLYGEFARLNFPGQTEQSARR